MLAFPCFSSKWWQCHGTECVSFVIPSSTHPLWIYPDTTLLENPGSLVQISEKSSELMQQMQVKSTCIPEMCIWLSQRHQTLWVAPMLMHSPWETRGMGRGWGEKKTQTQPTRLSCLRIAAAFFPGSILSRQCCFGTKSTGGPLFCSEVTPQWRIVPVLCSFVVKHVEESKQKETS